MTQREYRVVELTHGDNSLSFRVDYRNKSTSSIWLAACKRDTLTLAIDAIGVLKRDGVVSEEVVYVAD